ncbi:MAG TPA: hypothetical protein VGD65_14240 [Chryseosolibacter sp.]
MDKLEIKHDKRGIVIHIVAYSMIIIGSITSAFYTINYSTYPRMLALSLIIPLTAFFIWMVWILSKRLSDTSSIIILTKDFIDINMERPSRFLWNEIKEFRIEKRRLPKHTEIEILIIASEHLRKEVNLFYLDKDSKDILSFYIDVKHTYAK